MRRCEMVNRLIQAEMLIGYVRAYVKEHDHPIRDSNLLSYDYEKMVSAIREWDAK